MKALRCEEGGRRNQDSKNSNIRANPVPRRTHLNFHQQEKSRIYRIQKLPFPGSILPVSVWRESLHLDPGPEAPAYNEAGRPGPIFRYDGRVDRRQGRARGQGPTSRGGGRTEPKAE
jgi:hypothetical protein